MFWHTRDWTKLNSQDFTFKEKQCSSFLIAVSNECHLNINYLSCRKLSNRQYNSLNSVLITQKPFLSTCGWISLPIFVLFQNLISFSERLRGSLLGPHHRSSCKDLLSSRACSCSFSWDKDSRNILTTPAGKADLMSMLVFPISFISIPSNEITASGKE